MPINPSLFRIIFGSIESVTVQLPIMLILLDEILPGQ